MVSVLPRTAASADDLQRRTLPLAPRGCQPSTPIAISVPMASANSAPKPSRCVVRFFFFRKRLSIVPAP